MPVTDLCEPGCSINRWATSGNANPVAAVARLSTPPARGVHQWSRSKTTWYVMIKLVSGQVSVLISSGSNEVSERLQCVRT